MTTTKVNKLAPSRPRRERLGSLDDMVRLNIALPRSLRRRFKSTCSERDIDMSHQAVALIEAWLDGEITLPDGRE